METWEATWSWLAWNPSLVPFQLWGFLMDFVLYGWRILLFESNTWVCQDKLPWISRAWQFLWLNWIRSSMGKDERRQGQSLDLDIMTAMFWHYLVPPCSILGILTLSMGVPDRKNCMLVVIDAGLVILAFWGERCFMALRFRVSASSRVNLIVWITVRSLIDHCLLSINPGMKSVKGITMNQLFACSNYLRFRNRRVDGWSKDQAPFGLKTWETGHLQSSIPSMSWNKTSNFDHTVLLAVTQISTLCEASCNSYVHMNWYGSIWKPGVSTEFRLDIRDIRYEFTHV